MEKHFATDEKSWGSNPYGTSKLRCSSVVEHLIHIQVVRSSILLTATHGGYSLMVGRKLVALHVRVRFSLVTQWGREGFSRNWCGRRTISGLEHRAPIRDVTRGQTPALGASTSFYWSIAQLVRASSWYGECRWFEPTYSNNGELGEWFNPTVC